MRRSASTNRCVRAFYLCPAKYGGAAGGSMTGRILTLGCLLLYCVTPSVFAASLRFGAAVTDQADLTLPILLAGGSDERISALDFRLRYDPLVFEPLHAAAGAAAVAAGKQVQANMTRPGEYVVVLMGINWTPLGFGEVAKVTLRRIADPPNGNTTIRIDRTTFSTPEGEEAPSRGTEVLLQFAIAQGQPPFLQPLAEPPSQGTSSIGTEDRESAARGGSSGTMLADSDAWRQTREPESNERAEAATLPAAQTVAAASVVKTDGPAEAAKLQEAVRRADQVRAALPTRNMGTSSNQEPAGATARRSSPVFESAPTVSRTDAAEPATAPPPLELTASDERRPDASVSLPVGVVSQGVSAGLPSASNVADEPPRSIEPAPWKVGILLAAAAGIAVFAVIRRRAAR